MAQSKHRLNCYLVSILTILLVTSSVQATVVSQDRIETAVRNKILSSAQYESEDLSIEFLRVPSNVSLPGKNCRLLVSQQNSARSLGRLSFAVTAVAANGARKKCWVVAKVSARTPVVVAARSIAARSVIGAEDVMLVERDMKGELRGQPLTDPDLAVGKVSKRSLAKGRVLTQDMLVQAPTVKNKSVIRVEARIGGLCVSTLGVALRDGRDGETIPVRNMASGKTVYGVVQENGTVLVLVGGV